MFRIILGCVNVNSSMHKPIPTRINTLCPDRYTGKCSVECKHSITGFMSLDKISWKNTGASI